jgi:hypothetical protein
MYFLCVYIRSAGFLEFVFLSFAIALYFIKVMGLRKKNQCHRLRQRISATRSEYYIKAGDCKLEIPDRAIQIFWPNCFIVYSSYR